MFIDGDIDGVLSKVGRGLKRGARFTGRGVKRGAKFYGRTLKRGAKLYGRGLKRGAKFIGKGARYAGRGALALAKSREVWRLAAMAAAASLGIPPSVFNAAWDTFVKTGQLPADPKLRQAILKTEPTWWDRLRAYLGI